MKVEVKMENESTTKETLGNYSQTIWIFGKPIYMWIPLMNPQYLTENNLWDNQNNKL